MTKKYFMPPNKCSICGAPNPMFINRQTGKFVCERCFNKLHTCAKCKKVSINGIRVGKDWYCWDCYLKEWGIVQRKPKTEKDFRTLKDLSIPIWQR